MRNDDPDHFQVLVQRYRNQVYRLVASILGPDNEAEIAGLLGTNVQVVKSQLFRARRQLREKLEVKGWSYA